MTTPPQVEISGSDEKSNKADPSVLHELGQLAEQRVALDHEIAEVVRAAVAAKVSFAEIGAILGVSKHAAQRKYGHSTRAEAPQ